MIDYDDSISTAAPVDIVQRLNNELNRALHEPANVQRLKASGMTLNSVVTGFTAPAYGYLRQVVPIIG